MQLPHLRASLLPLAGTLALTAVVAACGSTKSSVGPTRMQGVVVAADLDTTWLAVQQTCSRLSGGTQVLDASARRAKMDVGAIGVTVAVSRKSDGGTIVRVQADEDTPGGKATVNRVLAEIQAAAR